MDPTGHVGLSTNLEEGISLRGISVLTKLKLFFPDDIPWHLASFGQSHRLMTDFGSLNLRAKITGDPELIIRKLNITSGTI